MLIEEQMVDCILYDIVRTPDLYGGYNCEYIESIPFQSAIVLNSSNEMQVAQAQGAKAIFNVITHKNMILSYHDAFRRLSDGKTFRVTSNGEENTPPRSSTLDMRVVTAEEWELPYE